eukprot:752801-Hanusia_phi.AAC.6
MHTKERNPAVQCALGDLKLDREYQRARKNKQEGIRTIGHRAFITFSTSPPHLIDNFLPWLWLQLPRDGFDTMHCAFPVVGGIKGRGYFRFYLQRKGGVHIRGFARVGGGSRCRHDGGRVHAFSGERGNILLQRGWGYSEVNITVGSCSHSKYRCNYT